MINPMGAPEVGVRDLDDIESKVAIRVVCSYSSPVAAIDGSGHFVSHLPRRRACDVMSHSKRDSSYRRPKMVDLVFRKYRERWVTTLQF